MLPDKDNSLIFDLPLNYSGGQIFDESGSGFIGTCYNSPTVSPGLTGNALNFNGSDQYIDFGNILNPHYNSFTITGSFQTSSSQCGVIDKALLGLADNKYGIYIESGKLTCAIQYSSSHREITTSFLVNDSKWHKFVAIYDRLSNMTFYVDGQLVGIANIAPGGNHDMNSNYRMFVGVYPDSTGTVPDTSWFLNGQIADIKIYNRVLAVDEFLTPKNDVLYFPASITSSSNNLTPAWTESAETFSAAINQLNSSSAAWTEPSEILVATIIQNNSASLAWTESAETLSAIIKASNTASPLWTESGETLSANIAQLNSLSILLVEPSEILSAQIYDVAGNALAPAWTESAETFSAAINQLNSSSAAWTEQPESLSANIAQLNSSAISWTESPETLSAIIHSSNGNNLAPVWTEQPELLTATIAQLNSTSVAWTESAESLAAHITISGLYQIPVGIYTAIDKAKSYKAIDKSRAYTIKGLS